MKKNDLIAAILDAPPERYGDIIKAARGTAARRPGTIKQASEILGCCPKTVARYVERGMITPVRLSQRKIVYDLNQIERLADGSL